MAKTCWKWLEMEGTAGNDWKLIKVTMIMLDNQMGWPYHSFDCVLLSLNTLEHIKILKCISKSSEIYKNQ